MKKDRHHPPRWADRFLEWYCRPELLEEIQGDIYELFYHRTEEKGPELARRYFAWDVFRSFRLSTIKGFYINHSTMLLKSNFKIALRQMSKQKMFSSIKIGGFALGVAVCLLIGLYILDELSYDKHYQNTDRIFRVIGKYEDDGGFRKQVFFPAPFAAAIKDDFPEIQQSGRFFGGQGFDAGNNQVRREDQDRNHYEEDFIYADPSLLSILEVPVISGDPSAVLTDPKTILISKEKADKFFPGEDPLGKILILNERSESSYKIVGVFEKMDIRSHFEYDFIMTMQGVAFWQGEQESWRANNYHTYVLLHPEAEPEALEQKLLATIDKYYIPSAQASGMTDAEAFSRKLSFELQPVSSIHLYSEGIFDGAEHGDIRYVRLFGAIAVIILFLACINFINLSTARSANRAKEVGLRKVIGSFRSDLVSQFLVESVVFSLFSFVLGSLLAWAILPFFNSLSSRNLHFPWLEWWFLPSLTVMGILVGIIAGMYPAFYLSSFQPIAVLRGKLSQGSKSANLRNSLVVFQFTATIILLICTFVIYQQMNFILNKKLGFDKEQMVLLEGVYSLRDQMPSLKQELLDLPEVTQVSVSGFLPVSGSFRNSNGFWKEGKVNEEPAVYGQIWDVDHDYIKTMGMNIVEGRDFLIQMPTDSQAVIINESMASALNLSNPIDQKITNKGASWKIIGVVEDFHFSDLKEDIEPLCMIIRDNPVTLSVKTTGSDMSSTLQSISQVWDRFSPNQPIRYSFLDERYAMMYAGVQRTGKIFTSFAVLAIIVACLGLFGLSTFVAEQRKKEMGVRKVLGASVQQIVGLLSKNFLILIALSLLIATPLGWYLMQGWLNDYAYRITISWQVFAVAGVFAILIGLLTISYQALRTARANPVKALRSE